MRQGESRAKRLPFATAVHWSHCKLLWASRYLISSVPRVPIQHSEPANVAKGSRRTRRDPEGRGRRDGRSGCDWDDIPALGKRVLQV